MNKLFQILFFFLFNHLAIAQVDTINSTSQQLDLTKLPFGESSYVVYYEDSSKNKIGSTEVWKRSCIVDKRNPFIQFQWKWYRDDSLLLETTNWCDTKTLAPVFRTMKYKQNTQIAFSIDQDSIRPTDSIHNNYAAQIPVRENKTGILNWELDLETFPCLPFHKVGQIFDISFFDFNEESTNYHRYIIEKEDTIAIAGVFIECWVIRIDYDAFNYSQFWVSKENPETLKMKEFANNSYRYKIKLY